MSEIKGNKKINEDTIYGAQLFPGWDGLPFSCVLWNEELKPIDCNQAALKLFDFKNKKELTEKFIRRSPESQIDETKSFEEFYQNLLDARIHKKFIFRWRYYNLSDIGIDTETTAVQVDFHGNRYLMTYLREMREIRGFTGGGEESQIILDAIPMCCTFWNENFNPIDCNQEAVNLFDLKEKQEYLDSFWQLSPQRQPDGKVSSEKLFEKIETAFFEGRSGFEWMHQKLNGELIPSEITLIRVKRRDYDIVAGYTRDLRESKATVAMMSRLEYLAFMDELTGIYNRRYFMDTAKEYFLDFRPYRKPISIMMMDIDNFKTINDTYGHIFGDIVLKHTAQISRRVLRSTDLFARYGGEEFIIMILDAEQDFAIRLAERMRRAVENAEMKFNDIVLKGTVSLGVATKTKENTTLKEMIQYADQALYTAKQSGRNTVKAYVE